jgi:DNA-directed RNA polymerase subunit RPC12/RpoP
MPRIIQVAHLKCKKCGAEFDYAYLPGGSLTSIRLGKSRYMRCPNCKKWSLFNIVDTRVDPDTHHCELRVGPS